MKNLTYLSEAQRAELIETIYDEAENWNLRRISVMIKMSILLLVKDQRRTQIVSDIINPEDQQMTITAYQKSNSEVKQYQDAALTKEETDEGPLVWWKHNIVHYPCPKQVGYKIFSHTYHISPI